jgi:hypothetical protein
MSVPELYTIDSPFSNYQEILKRQTEIAREGIEMLKWRKLYPDSNGASVICLETMSTGGFHDNNSISLKTVTFEAFLESRGAPRFLPHSHRIPKKVATSNGSLHGSMNLELAFRGDCSQRKVAISV